MAFYEYGDFATEEEPELTPAPSVEDIRERYLFARQYYVTLKEAQQLWHEYYHLQIKTSTPSGYETVLPATARIIVNDAADHIASARPLFTVPHAGFSKTQEERAEKQNKWMKAFWHRLNEGKTMPLHRTMAVNAMKGGMIANHIVYVPDRIPKPPGRGASDQDRDEYETRRRLAFPFEIVCEDPRYVYPDPGTDGQTWVIQHFYKKVGDVMTQHPEWSGWRDAQGKRRNINEFVEWIYYTDRHWRAYVADWKFVTMVPNAKVARPVRHGLGYVPWVIRSAGLSDDSPKPEERYESMIFIAKGLLDEEIRAMSQAQAIIKDTAWPWTLVPEGVKAQPGTRTYTEIDPQYLDKVKQMRPDAEAPKAVLEWIEMIEDKIERATYSSVVTGRAPAGQRSGYSIAVLAGMARVKFQPILDNLESALAETMRKVLLLIENKVKATVPIYIGADTDYELGPSDIRNYERIECNINPTLVQDRAADADIGMRLYQAGLSRETLFREYAHIENPLEEMDKRVAEDFLYQQAIQAVMMYEIAKRRGIPRELLQAYTQGTGIGAPGGPGGASGQNTPPGQSSPGGTPPAMDQGMAGTTQGGGAPPPPGRPSVPLSGPTSPLGGQGEALREVGMLPGEMRRADVLNGPLPLSGSQPLG